MSERFARFHVRVHAENRHAGLGTPMVILAATRKEAVDRALDLGGWTGNQRRYGRVTIDKIEDVHPDHPVDVDADAERS
jgi:hypothetical protein